LGSDRASSQLRKFPAQRANAASRWKHGRAIGRDLVTLQSAAGSL
jgi:hypothetical protein